MMFLCLHVNRPDQAKPVKFMHYFYDDKLLDELVNNYDIYEANRQILEMD